jgi:ABC-type transport system involved in multi-copper enzyme maturation permease subunit
MTAASTVPYRSSLPPGRDGFAQLLKAEWTKLRTVRASVLGFAVAGLLIVGLSALTGLGSHSGFCVGGRGRQPTCYVGHPTVPIGPGGQPVEDDFFFVHQTLEGDGSITARVTSLTGSGAGLQPWAKAGVILEPSTVQGAPYAALMITGSHGVRLQWDYVHDVAGSPGSLSSASPRWLRLTRSGDLLTGSESTNGTRWTRVGVVRLAGLPSTVQVGLFATSPLFQQITVHPLGSSGVASTTSAAARFEDVALRGNASGSWTGTSVRNHQAQVPGLPPSAMPPDEVGGSYRQTGPNAFTVSGAGDIAPSLDAGQKVGDVLASGAFAGLIAIVVVATLFMTAEYRRRLIAITFAASPRRGRVLAAKAVVIGSVAFVVALAGASLALAIGLPLLRHNGNFIYPAGFLTQVRVVGGVAALVAVTAVLALAVGTLLRRSATAVTMVVVGVVLPFVLGVASVLPTTAANWILRLTPAAAWAIQQTVPRYPQVISDYSPSAGFFPLSPWAGFAVLCVYAGVAMGFASSQLRRRDA